jgi:hypothetical protein
LFYEFDHARQRLLAICRIKDELIFVVELWLVARRIEERIGRNLEVFKPFGEFG